MEQFTESNKVTGSSNEHRTFHERMAEADFLSIRHNTAFLQVVAQFADDEIDAANGQADGQLMDFGQERRANLSLMTLFDTVDFFCNRRVQESQAQLEEAKAKVEAEAENLRRQIGILQAALTKTDAWFAEHLEASAIHQTEAKEKKAA